MNIRHICILLLTVGSALPYVVNAEAHAAGEIETHANAISGAYETRTYGTMVRTLRMRGVRADGVVVAGEPERAFLVMGDAEGGVSGTGYISESGDANGRVLEVSWDEMSHDVRQYTFMLKHLDRNGVEDRLSSSEFLRGFTTKDVVDYEHSFNTQQLYTHYTITIPNEDMTLTASGNYVIVVYEDGDREKVVLTQRFEVVEPMVKMDVTITPNTDIELSGRYQQLEVELSKLNSNNPVNDYSIEVRQNGRMDNRVMAPKPSFVGGNRLQWQHCRALIFEGGNEYRHYDTYSTYMAGTGVDRILFDRNDYHAVLMADEIMGDHAYMHQFDANGQFLINAERTNSDETEAEYMWVHWTLPAEQPWFDGAVYVMGDLFQNRMTLENRMQYDNDAKCYYLTALMKQGGYDYQYVFVSKGERLKVNGDRGATTERTEGSYWQTGNEYRVIVYYHPFGARYDRIVGVW